MGFEKSPVVKGSLAKQYADDYYSIEDDIFPIFEKLDTPFLDKRIKPGIKLFDAMMGRGRHAIRYAARGADVWGNDLNPHMVAIAKKAAKKAKLRMRFSSLDACTLRGVPKDKFDMTIAMFSALGTIPKSANRQKALLAMARVTRPGGVVIVHAHNRLDAFFKSGFRLWAIQTTLNPGPGLETGDSVSDYNGLKNMFNHFYTPGEFREEFRNAGLIIEEESYWDYEKKKILTGVLRKFFADGFVFVGRKPDVKRKVRR